MAMSAEIQTPETRADEWAEVDRAFDELHRGFLGAWGIPSFGGVLVPAPTSGVRAPRTDVQDLGDSYRVVVEVPGIPKEKLVVTVRGTVVEVSGEAAIQTDRSDAGYVHRERTVAAIRRTLELPEPVVATGVAAKVENGLLQIDLPKEHPTSSPAEVRVAVQ
jgi:HSP20 family protein